MQGNKKYLLIALLLVVLVLGGLLLRNRNKSTEPVATQQEPQSVLPKEVTVTLTKNGFEPKNVTIRVGSAVRWVNDSGDDNATVNSDDHPAHKENKEMNLGTFSAGSTLVHIFTTPGTYGYHDHFHPEKIGTVTVEE